jgi:hypothetical protein
VSRRSKFLYCLSMCLPQSSLHDSNLWPWSFLTDQISFVSHLGPQTESLFPGCSVVPTDHFQPYICDVICLNRAANLTLHLCYQDVWAVLEWFLLCCIIGSWAPYLQFPPRSALGSLTVLLAAVRPRASMRPSRPTVSRGGPIYIYTYIYIYLHNTIQSSNFNGIYFPTLWTWEKSLDIGWIEVYYLANCV